MKPLIKFTTYLLLTGTCWIFSCKKEPAINKAPKSNAGTDQTIALPMDSISLDGSLSSDPDGSIVKYVWTKISGPASFIIADASAKKTMIKNLAPGSYGFELTVTDNGGLSARDTTRIMVTAAPTSDQSPIASAGPDQTITLPLDSTWLDGSGSSPNGWGSSSSTSYVWTKISGPPAGVVSPVTLKSPGYTPTTAIAKNLVPGTYLFRLAVSNSTGSDADTIQITVVDDPLNKNTVTYHDLIWEGRDNYGLGSVDIFVTASIRPDLFYSETAYRPIEVYLNMEPSSLWISVPYKGNSLYTYDMSPLLLWIICYPNNTLLVGKKASIKIKLL